MCVCVCAVVLPVLLYNSVVAPHVISNPPFIFILFFFCSCACPWRVRILSMPVTKSHTQTHSQAVARQNRTVGNVTTTSHGGVYSLWVNIFLYTYLYICWYTQTYFFFRIFSMYILYRRTMMFSVCVCVCLCSCERESHQHPLSISLARSLALSLFHIFFLYIVYTYIYTTVVWM